MSYTHTTFAEAKDALAGLLGDSSKVFYTDTELGLYIKEALRAWGLYSEYWRETVSLQTSPGVAFYDIRSAVDITSTAILASTVTDRDLIQESLYHLMEIPITNWASAWPGTEMFSLGEMADLLSRSCDSLIFETGMTVVEDSYFMVGGQARVTLPETTIYIRRLSAKEDGGTFIRPLWRIDRHQAQTTSRSAIVPEQKFPRAYSLEYSPLLSFDLWPTPITQGTLYSLVCESMGALDPATAATIFQVPNDAAHLIKYGMMADILSKDGLSTAVQFAQYCTERWKRGVDQISRYHTICWATVNGRRIPLTSLSQRDSVAPEWQSTTGMPTKAATPSLNLVALSPVPDDVYTITCEVVRPAVLPTLDADYLQIGPEHMQSIWNYSQHLACMKLQGSDFEETFPMLQEFFQAAELVRQKRAAEAPTYWELERIPRRDEQWTPLWAPQTTEQSRQELSYGRLQ